MSDPRRTRISDLTSMPDDVPDPLLWRLALDVVAAHQPGDDGHCRNLQCAGHTAPCPAFVAARRAMHLASPAPTPPAAPSTTTAVVARGRAAVPAPTNPGRFTEWFTSPLLAGGRDPVPVPPRARTAA